MSRPRHCFAIILSLLFTSTGLAQQADFEAGIRAAQVKLAEIFSRESDSISDDCGRIKRNMNTRELGEQYLNCVMERFQRALVGWNNGHRAFLETTRGEVKNMFLAQAPQGPTHKEERAKFANAAGYLHNRLAGWHQHLATTVEGLYRGQFIIESSARELVATIQENLSTATRRARTFVGEIQAEGAMEAARVRELIDTFIDQSFADAMALIDTCQGKFNTDYLRLQRQIPTDFSLRDERFREVVDLYEGIALRAIGTFISQSTELWVKLDIASPTSN